MVIISYIPVHPVNGYKIERSPDGSSWSTIVANTSSTSVSYTDSGLNTSATYYYRVSGINGDGVGTASSSANATTQAITISIQSPTNSTVLDSWIWANATINQNASLVMVSLDGGVNASLSNTSGNWNGNVSGMSNGAHRIIFYANDTSGNMNSTTVFFTVDIVSLNITVGAPLNSSYSTNSILATLTLNRNGQDTVVMSLDGAANTSMSNSSGNWNYQLSNLANGAHSVKFYANDTAGRTAPPQTVFFTVTGSSFSVSQTTAWWNDSVNVSGVGNASVSVTATINGVPACSTTTSSGGLWNCTFLAPLSIGPYNLSVVVGTAAYYTKISVKPSYGQKPTGTTQRSVLETPFVILEPSGALRMLVARLTVSHGTPT